MTAIDRARADIEEGHLWRARQRLSSRLVESPEGETVEMLARVHLAMGDLPAAGALLFTLERDDDVAREAIAVWRARHGSADARWRSIPRPVREGSTSAAVARLRVEAGVPERAGRRGTEVNQAQNHQLTRGERLADAGCVTLVLALATWCAVMFAWGVASFVAWICR